LAAAVLIFGAIGFAVWKNGQDHIDRTQAELAQKEANQKAELAGLQANMQAAQGVSPEEIAAINTDKVVQIEMASKLIHAPTGDDVYHRYEVYTDKKTKTTTTIPVYVEVDGVIEPLLDLKKNVTAGRPIVLQGSGSGFVVDKAGFILTNRHVAASWNAPYTFPEDAFPGVFYRFVGGELIGMGIITAEMGQNMRWVPSETKLFGAKPASGKIIDGVNTYLDVTFAKTNQRTPAKVVRVSTKHDVAMIKIDLPSDLPAVTLKDANASIAPGQKIVTMGYPGISPSVIVATNSNDAFNRNMQINTVPDPTVTDGSIGKIIRGGDAIAKQNYFSFMGDYYQLTINATGSGNSGGPVFDKNGNVIGIFTAATWSGDATRISFAVPISFGMELMGNTKVIR
jgi:serine protease Do